MGEASRRLGYILTAANTILFGFAFFDRREQRARSQRIEGLIEGLQGKIFDGMTSEESSATLGPGLSESEKSGGEVYAGAPGDDDFTDDDFTAITADATKDESDDAVVVGDEERGGGASGHTSSDAWVKYGGWALAAVIFTVAMGVRSN